MNKQLLSKLDVYAAGQVYYSTVCLCYIDMSVALNTSNTLLFNYAGMSV